MRIMEWYIVTDDRGCCTTVDIGVSCQDDPCIYYLCWEELQGVHEFLGFNVAGDPTYFFNSPYPIVGNYHEIRDEMLAIMDANFIDYGTFMSNHADYDCLKSNGAGTNVIPGYFFIDSPNEIESFTVTMASDPLTPVEIPFNQVDCN